MLLAYFYQILMFNCFYFLLYSCIFSSVVVKCDMDLRPYQFIVPVAVGVIPGCVLILSLLRWSQPGSLCGCSASPDRDQLTLEL